MQLVTNGVVTLSGYMRSRMPGRLQLVSQGGEDSNRIACGHRCARAEEEQGDEPEHFRGFLVCLVRRYVFVTKHALDLSNTVTYRFRATEHSVGSSRAMAQRQKAALFLAVMR